MSRDAAGAIQLEESGRRGRYSLDLGGGGEAEMTFARDGEGAMVVHHTFVPPQFRGQGVALKLVERAVADARQAGTKIAPLCPYVAAEFRHHPEWADVVKR